jgi:predicted DNA-binding transcriptional regulator AlpA
MATHLNEDQLAKRWKISERTLQRWRSTDKGPAFLKLGWRVVYAVSDIEAWEQQQRVMARSNGGARR